MPRRRIVDRRDVLADPVYNSPLVTKFINGLMWGGKKSTAEGIFYRALQQVGDKTGEDPLKMFKRAIENVRPTVRSEEHTSELQSQSNLVCRLLLEKKKTKKKRR